MKKFDTLYISPSGIVGIHYAVEAKSINDAAIKSQLFLSSGTYFLPTQFIILRVRDHSNKPLLIN